MRCAIMLALLGLVACGPPPEVGVWRLQEHMIFRCRGDGGKTVSCDDASALDPAVRTGRIHIEALDQGQLRLIDVDGRVAAGTSYVDGARFRWHSAEVAGDSGCRETWDEILELKVDADRMTGTRREVVTRDSACEAASVADVGHAISAERLEDSGS